MEAKVIEVHGGKVRGIRDGKLDTVDDLGEVWKYDSDYKTKWVLVPGDHPDIWWGRRRLLLVNGGDVVAWCLERSKYSETVIPRLVEGVVVKKAIENLRAQFDWKKWLVIGGLILALVFGVMYFRGSGEAPSDAPPVMPGDRPGARRSCGLHPVCP